jgi:hypothetical protein
MGGKCPIVILANFQKWEENIWPSFYQIFNTGRKLSISHSVNFSNKGGKYLHFILPFFLTEEEIVLATF